MRSLAYAMACCFSLMSLAGSGSQAKAIGISMEELAASKVETIRCPAVSDDFTQILAKMDALRASIKQDAKCKSVGDSIGDHFNTVIKDRDRFLELVKKAQSSGLTDEDASAITDYVSQMTEKASMLVDLMKGNTDCFLGDSQKEAYVSVSGLVSEAAAFMSLASGPWGPIVNLGGKLLSGLITTIDKIIKNQSGYDFSDRVQWMSYVQNLCTYHNLRQEVKALLHPQESISQLELVKSKLDQNLAVIAQANNGTPLTNLNTQVKSAQTWVARRIDQIRDDSSGYWNNVTGKAVLSEADGEMNDFLIRKEAPKFLAFQLDSASRDMDDLEQYLFATGQVLVHEAHRAGVISSEPPIDPGIMDAAGFGFLPYPSTDGSAFFMSLTQTDWRLQYRKLGRAQDDLEFRLMNARKQAQDKFDKAAWTFGVAYVFCDFFGEAEFYNDDIHSVCISNQFHYEHDVVNRLLVGQVQPQWKKPSAGVIRAANWTEALDLWTEKVQTAVQKK